jgi:Na+/melibiose symporter-like transporter
MWGVVYQGYNAVFPSFYPELFPTRARVSGMAIAQNIGTMLTAFLPALFAAVAPPGSTNVPLTVGALAFGVTIISALSQRGARVTPTACTSTVSAIRSRRRPTRRNMTGCGSKVSWRRRNPGPRRLARRHPNNVSARTEPRRDRRVGKIARNERRAIESLDVGEP